MERLFAALLRARWPIVLAYALLVPPAIWLALHVPSDGGIDRLIVESDPDYLRTRAFHAVFPEGQHAVLLFEAIDACAPRTLAAITTVETRLSQVPRVSAFSALSVYRRLHPGFVADQEQSAAFCRFARGTSLFAQQGLIGEQFLGIALALTVSDGAERDAALAAIDSLLTTVASGDVARIRRVGGPYVDAWLEHETGRASQHYFPLFGLFLVTLIAFLFRSLRTLVALLIALGVSVLLGVAFAGLVGYRFTIVSSLVPLTILITSTATLVYIHSRFVDRPEGRPVVEHHLFALSNKFLACSASVFAAAVGFAALGVSQIRPIRELGLWTAAALAITWLVSFTLFPALQSLLATPTGHERLAAGRWFLRLAELLPRFSHRHRWSLVLLALALSLAGALALFGFPGLLKPMPLEVDALDYIDPTQPVYQDTRYFEQHVGGLSVSELWIKTAPGAVTTPDFLAALDRFSQRLEAEPDVTSAIGISTLLRFMRYARGAGDRLPTQTAEWQQLVAELEQQLLTEPELASFVDVGSLAETHVTVIGRAEGSEGYAARTARMQALWAQAQAGEPALRDVTLEVVGQGVLQAKIAGHLVPTLTESFALTAGIIFITFFAVFRSGAARLMAMIPSLFAILVMFLVMRLSGLALNVATILIASTVLGASENDQIHFFYHFQERRRSGDVAEALDHTLRVSGQAIFFATLINAAGFLALALSPLPPMRQFGIVAACAFVLSMIADFTALPAALWLLLGRGAGPRKQASSPTVGGSGV